MSLLLKYLCFMFMGVLVIHVSSLIEMISVSTCKGWNVLAWHYLFFLIPFDLHCSSLELPAPFQFYI